MKNLVVRLLAYVKSHEPVAAIAAVSTAVLAFTEQAQGDLTGQDAWVAVGIALVTLITRRSVTSPATAAKLKAEDPNA